MDLRKLQRLVIDALEDIKGQDIRVYDTTLITSLFDRVVLVSGTSNRQTRSMASHVRDQVKQAGGHVISVEGEESGEWVLVDLGDIVVHVMQPAIRAYYNLEELWGAKPVRIKLGAAGGPGKGRVASESMEDDDEAAPAAKPAATTRPRATSKATDSVSDAKAGAKGGARGGAKAGSKAGPKVGATAGSNTGSKTGAKTGAKAGSSAGSKAGSKAVPKTGATTGATRPPRPPRAAKPRADSGAD